MSSWLPAHALPSPSCLGPFLSPKLHTRYFKQNSVKTTTILPGKYYFLIVIIFIVYRLGYEGSESSSIRPIITELVSDRGLPTAI